MWILAWYTWCIVVCLLSCLPRISGTAQTLPEVRAIYLPIAIYQNVILTKGPVIEK